MSVDWVRVGLGWVRVGPACNPPPINEFHIGPFFKFFNYSNSHHRNIIFCASRTSTCWKTSVISTFISSYLKSCPTPNPTPTSTPNLTLNPIQWNIRLIHLDHSFPRCGGSGLWFDAEVRTVQVKVWLLKNYTLYPSHVSSRIWKRLKYSNANPVCQLWFRSILQAGAPPQFFGWRTGVLAWRGILDCLIRHIKGELRFSCPIETAWKGIPVSVLRIPASLLRMRELRFPRSYHQNVKGDSHITLENAWMKITASQRRKRFWCPFETARKWIPISLLRILALRLRICEFWFPHPGWESMNWDSHRQ